MLIAVGVLAAVFVIGLLALRFVLLPRWQAQPSQVANFVGDRIGLPVAIGTLETSWDWWRPQLTARDVKIFPATKASADSEADAPSDAEAQVALPEVGAQIDTWNSLLHLDVRFQRLWIDQPTLIVRRDTAGRFFVGGVLLMASPEANEDGDGSGGKFVDWLLRQRAIEINGGTIEWRDEKRGAPPLIVEQMDFRAERSLSHYRFGLRGDLVSETGAAFEVRGEAAIGLLQRSFDRDWQGYVRLDRVDLGSLRQWLDLPIAMTQGEGNVQTWVTLSKHRVVSATVDMALQNVKADLAPAAKPAIAPLELQEIRGRFTGREERNRLSFSTEGLTFVEKSGARLEPMNVSLTLEGLSPATPLPLVTLLTQAPSGRFEFDRLNVSALSGLLPSLPLPDGWREPLAALDARGMLESGSGSWERVRESNKNAANENTENEKTANENAANENASDEAWRLIHYSARATVRNAGVQAYGNYPGLRGISGTVSFDEQQGSLTLAGREVALDLPHVFPEALALDTVGGNVHWTHKPEGLAVQIDALHFANPDVEGTIKGTWRANGSDGVADLSAQVQRATASGAYRYIPKVAGEHVRHWLQESLKGGVADHGTVTLKGELEHFPFVGGKYGSFVAEAHVAGGRLAYDPAWPVIDGLEADLRFENETMTITAKRGSTLDATLGQTRATIPDLGSHHPHLHIEGSASGPLTAYLNFLDQSPVGGWLDHMLKGAQASGNGALALKLDISLSGDEANAVKGSFKLADDTLDIPGVPLLSHTRGTVSFTEHEVKADALSFETLGGAGTLALSSRDGGITLTGSGTANLAKLHVNETSPPLLDRLSGTVPWQLTFSAGGNKGTHWVLTSPLVGAAIDLPEPLGKSTNAMAPLRIAHDAAATTTSNKEEHWRIDYRSPSAPLTVIAKSVPVGESWKLERALLHLGDTRGATLTLPTTPGLSVRGALARFSTEPWYALYQSLPKHEEANALPLDEVDVSVGTLNALGRQLHEAKISARKTTNLWNISLASREAEGNMTWEQADANGAVNGRLKGYFTRLALAESKDERSAIKQKISTTMIPGSANPWPMIDFKIDRFSYKDKTLGQLSIQAEPRGTDWRMENVALANADGVVTANGWWRTARQAQRTELNIETKINDAEKFLEHFGVPRSVVAADVQLDGALSWAGAPSDFDIGSLDGHLTLNVGRGHFTRIEPGIGRLLGVFSLQALPRRITLDFRDVFSEGFAFDTITGAIDLKEGILHTADLLMNGASAKVKLSGTVDLSKETQNLNVYVQPSLTDSVSVGAAGASVLLMANPVGAAAVGIGALVGQLILGNPIEKIFSYEYTVKGSWDDPVVEKKSREGLQLPPPDEASAAESKPENQTP